MNNNKSAIIITSIIILLSVSCTGNNQRSLPDNNHTTKRIAVPGIKFMPERYICYMADEINIDGILDENSWKQAEWTKDFVDIEGESMPAPLYQTRAKMLWDKEYFYIAAEIIEPHIQAKLRKRDTVIFYDNDFEVFIDPDGDSHGYYEIELNALNTVWDLLLTMPYRDKGNRVIDAWDIRDLRSAIKIYGTLNDPSDIDDKWTVEMAVPVDVLSECGPPPADGLQWRVNFSRVNWRTEHNSGTYTKKKDSASGKALPEFNWVWSPQGIINMHYPEMWGYVQFAETPVGSSTVKFIDNADEEIKWVLRKLYYAQREYASVEGVYSSSLEELNKLSQGPIGIDISILIKPTGYEAYCESKISGLTWTIDNSGRVYSF